MEMQSFTNAKYTVILGCDDGNVECASCSSEYEVFQVITDRVHDEIMTLLELNDGFNGWTDLVGTQEFADTIMATKVVADPEVLIDCYDTFFADCWWFKVLDDEGRTWFEYVWGSSGVYL